MKFSILLAGAALVFTPMNVAQAANVEIVAQNPVIELSVSEQVDSAPDTAMFSTGVETKAPTATQALRDNSAQARAVIDRLKSLGIAERTFRPRESICGRTMTMTRKAVRTALSVMSFPTKFLQRSKIFPSSARFSMRLSAAVPPI